MRRIDELCEGGSFKLDGKAHTILRFENGKVWCERDDGEIVVLDGWHEPESYDGIRSPWFPSFLIP